MNSSIVSRIFQVLALATTAGTGFFFYQKNMLQAENQLLKQTNAELQTKVDACDKRRERADMMEALLRDTDTRAIKLTDGKAYHITIFHNELRKECALDVTGIPITSDGKFPECWAVVEGGERISLGMVDLNAPAGWQPLPFKEHVKTYIISLEKSPQGNKWPTYEMAEGDL